MKKFLFGFFCLLPFCANALNTVSITPIKGMPPTTIENSKLTGLTYNLHNNSPSDTYIIGFTGLNQSGITYTTTCGSLAPGADCGLTLQFDAPSIPEGQPNYNYKHPFVITGAPKSTSYTLSTLIIPGGTTYAVGANISLNSEGVTPTPSTFTVTFTSTSGGATYTFPSVAFGSSTLTPNVNADNYSVTIAPSSVTGSDTFSYNAPAAQTINVTQARQIVNLQYVKDSSVATFTAITAPNIGSATVAVTATCNTGTYGPHSQSAGTVAFDNILPGTCNLTAANYTGTDSNVYVPTLSNPYTVDSSSTTFPITYTAVTPSTQAVTTNIIAPNLPSGQTVAITLADGANTYGPLNQPAGSAHFATVVEATDYTLTCASYVVGPTTYSCTPSNPYTVSPSSTVINITYVGVTPGGNYDWHTNHMAAIKAANFGAIIWGGGSTTGPIQISSNPPANPKLISTIAAYEASPLPVQTTAQIKNFPNYIAQGSVSEFTPGVTTQFAAQQLDVDNHYEGNGDANAGCFFEQQNASGASSGVQTDYFYTATVNAGTQPFNWSTGVNLVPAGTYTITGDQYVASLVGGGFQQYTGKIGTPIQVDATHITIPETYTALPKNTANSNPVLSNTNTVTFSVPTYISTNVTFPSTPPPFNNSQINLASNLCGSMYYSWGGYAPQIDNIATQAKAVKTANGHTLIAGSVFYTTRFSDGSDAVLDDITNPESVTTAFYNLMYEAQRMQYQFTTNGVPMALLLNPDATFIFQNCGQYYCPLSWKPGITQDPKTILLANPLMQTSIFKALDRMQAKGYLTSGQVSTLKADFISNGILTPGSGRTVPGIPEYLLAVNWVVKSLASDIPFGNGNNIYDSTNPLLLPAPPGGTTAPYQTAAATWIHKVNHLGYSPSQVTAAITLQGQRYANYLIDMNFVGKAGTYKPDFIFFDKYERDEFVNFVGSADGLNYPDPTYVNGGYEFNGVDWDSYLAYMAVIDSNIGNIPLILWQMPGGQMYTSADTVPGVPAPHVGVPTTITSAGGVATVTMPSAHGLTSGNIIQVVYAAQAPYNGSQTITVTGANTFTYPVTGSPASPATVAPGAPYIEVAGLPSTRYVGASTPTWVFGDATLNNDMSNLNSALGIVQVPFTPLMNSSVYFTKNSGVANASQYLKLTSSSAFDTVLTYLLGGTGALLLGGGAVWLWRRRKVK